MQLKNQMTHKNDCCVALILKDFGEKTPMGNGNIVDGVIVESNNFLTSTPEFNNFEGFKSLLKEKVKQHDKGWGDNKIYHAKNMAVVQAITISSQPKTEEALEKLGFTRFGPLKKLKHPSTTLSVWLMAIPDFLKAIDWND